jgi:putative SOS response-associated peptidase YedK
MCGRFVSTAPPSVIAEEFKVDQVTVGQELEPSWNVAPTMDVYAVTSSKDGTVRRLETLRWGLVPSWAKDPSVGNRMINARGESLGTRAAYRSALETRRCIVPTDGFYEWKRSNADEARDRRTRVPYYARPTRGGRFVALAGLWEVWHDAEGHPLRSFTIITTRANSALEAIHDRMPVILPPKTWDQWLEPKPLSPSGLAALIAPASPDLLEISEVSTRVNRVTNDGPDLIDPVVSG